jgi:hypothetical protein
MSDNNIRACFCIPEPLNEAQLGNLLNYLSAHNCEISDRPYFNEGNWIAQELHWNILGKTWDASLGQIVFGDNEFSTLSFNVDGDFFLPGAKTSYSPMGDPKFALYKDLLIQIIKLTNPFIGEFDYEADLIYAQLVNNPSTTIASWGNFIPSSWTEKLNSKTQSLLLDTVDEAIFVEDRGLITFIHPMAANRAWGHRHEILDKILKGVFNAR